MIDLCKICFQIPLVLAFSAAKVVQKKHIGKSLGKVLPMCREKIDKLYENDDDNEDEDVDADADAVEGLAGQVGHGVEGEGVCALAGLTDEASDHVLGLDAALIEEFAEALALVSDALHVRVIDEARIDIVTEADTARRGHVVADGENRHMRTESRQRAGGHAGRGSGDQIMDIKALASDRCMLAEVGVRVRRVVVDSSRNNIRLAVEFGLGLTAHFGHGLDCLTRISTVSRFAGEHDGIGVGEDGIGDIADFGTGRTRILDHGMEHLGSDDDGLVTLHTFTNQHALNAGDFLLCHLDTQVATSDHDTVGHIEDFIDVIHALLVLNFGDDFHIAVMCIEDGLHIEDILLGTNEGMGHEIDVFGACEFEVMTVFFRQRRKIDADTGDIDGFTLAEFAMVGRFGNEDIVAFIDDGESDLAIVNEDGAADGNIGDEIGVVHRDTLVGSDTAGITDHFHAVTGFENQETIRAALGENGGSDFGAFGVDEDGDLFADGTHVGDQMANAIVGQVGGVHTDYIEAAVVEIADKIDVTALVADGADNLGFLLYHRWNFVCASI